MAGQRSVGNRQRLHPVGISHEWRLPAVQHVRKVLHFRNVSLGIPIEEEILERLGRGSPLRPAFHRSFEKVVRPDDASGAKRLDALVIAVAATSAVADQANP